MDMQSIKYRNNPDLSLLPEVFSAFPHVQAVYLFGSVANKRMNKESDMDLAVLSNDCHPHQHRLDILSELARRGFCNVDLVSLDTNDIVLKYEAVSPNQLIYQCEDFDRGAYYSKIIRQYLDFLPYLDVQREAYKRRILNGQA
jgi:predicted nucleotidyltransferase